MFWEELKATSKLFNLHLFGERLYFQSLYVHVGATVVGCGEHSWKHDMNDDLLRLLIGKAHYFEAGIR